MSLYEVLKARKTGLSPDLYTLLRARQGMSESVITAEPPIYFKSDGTALIDYLISGNTTQSGAPTPESPIFPQGCGELETYGEKAGQYKIPISSANTTTNIYLGEVQTTRKIKKLVLDGTENWEDVNLGHKSAYFRLKNGEFETNIQDLCLCTHFEQEIITSSTTNVGCNVINSPTLNYDVVAIRPKIITTTSDFKSWLTQRYAAGTPVTVWYVLATPETAVVNEPLMKIGDYADTVSKEQAGVQILTVKGNNELNISTTVTPEVTLKGKIKQLPDSDMNALLSVMEEM